MSGFGNNYLFTLCISTHTCSSSCCCLVPQTLTFCRRRIVLAHKSQLNENSIKIIAFFDSVRSRKQLPEAKFQLSGKSGSGRLSIFSTHSVGSGLVPRKRKRGGKDVGVCWRWAAVSRGAQSAYQLQTPEHDPLWAPSQSLNSGWLLQKMH